MRRSQRSSKKRWLVSIAAILLAIGCLWLVIPPRHEGSLGENTSVTKELILGLLQRSLNDDENTRRRDGISRWSPVIGRPGEAVWNRAYSVAYAQEKLVFLGKTVVPVLTEISSDSAYTNDIRKKAVETLSFFHELGIVQQIYLTGSQGVLNHDMIFILRYQVPLSDQTLGENPDLIGWLGSVLKKPISQVRLCELDNIMKAEGYAQGGLDNNGSWDYRVLQWLDRLYDVDLRRWLAENAPEAFAFREAQLERGYDPVIAFRNIRPAIFENDPYEGIKHVIDNLEEQEACKQLLEAVYDRHSVLHPPRDPAWVSNLKKWYWTNRGEFVFEPGRYQFAVSPEE